jgi:hypothetical protein
VPSSPRKSDKIFAPTLTFIPPVQLLVKKTMNNRKAVVARLAGQSVKLYDERGRNIASIPAPHAVSAQANGNAVSVTFPRGSVKVYDARGRHRANIP